MKLLKSIYLLNIVVLKCTKLRVVDFTLLAWLMYSTGTNEITRKMNWIFKRKTEPNRMFSFLHYAR